jgi:hypothetical protein
LGAAWLELKRIGWGWPSACVLVKECGTELNLLECSAAAVAKELRDAVMRDHAQKLATREWPRAEAGTRVAFEPIVRALATKRWDTMGKGIVRGVACGAIWTRCRLEQSATGWPTPLARSAARASTTSTTVCTCASRGR